MTVAVGSWGGAVGKGGLGGGWLCCCSSSSGRGDPNSEPEDVSYSEESDSMTTF